MLLWFLLALDFILQEPATSSALLLTAYQEHYDLLLVHALFVAITVLDACVGYWIGGKLKDSFSQTKLGLWIGRRAEQFEKFAGAHGKRAALFLWGPALFPYSAMLAPWFGYSFSESVLILVAGDTALWYGSEWLVVLGVKTIVPNPLAALFIGAGVMLALALGFKYLLSRWR